MKNLNYYRLDPEPTLTYLKDHLEKVNALSTAIVNNVNFNEGEFFTLLWDKVSKEQLYSFRFGGVGGSVRDEIRDIVLEEVKKLSDLICVFDDFNSTYKPPYDDPLFFTNGVHYEDQIYYIVNHRDISINLLDECFYASEAIWHSLCILSKDSLSIPKNHSIKEAELNEIARNANLIIIGAYDAESYILWKKTSFKLKRLPIP